LKFFIIKRGQEGEGGEGEGEGGKRKEGQTRGERLREAGRKGGRDG
jgi:hypothetical protein